MPKPNEKTPEVQDQEVNPSEASEQRGPTIAMTGVSGKKIIADVKVVKVKKKAKPPVESKVQPALDPQAQPSQEQVPASAAQGAQPSAEATSRQAKQPKADLSEAKPEQKPGASAGGAKTPAATEVKPKPAQPLNPVEKPTSAAAVRQTESSAKPTPAPVRSERPTSTQTDRPMAAASQADQPATAQPQSAARTAQPGSTGAKAPMKPQASESRAAAKPVAKPTEKPAEKSPEKPSGETAGKVDPAKSGLAATAAYFAARAAARKKAAEQRIQQADQRRHSGNRPSGGGNRPDRGNRPTGGGYAGGYNKDKDADSRPPQSQPRTPARRNNNLQADLMPATKDSGRGGYHSRTHDKNRNRNERTRELPERSRNAKGRRFEAFEDEYSRGRRKTKKREKAAPVIHAVLTNISLPEVITVKEFAEAIKKTSAEVIKVLMKMGVMATLNQELDYDTAAIIAGEFGIETEKLVEVTEEDILFDDSDDREEDLLPRPPVVCVMGHVDHGKTSLLDYIRSAEVARGEAGGITQHIGAYMVDLEGRKITFLDTPGHEAFTTMRARGAQATDIAILVVAADDGVMPQTVEAINHAKAAGTQLIVAINKMDRPGANPERVKQELAKHEVISEDWGGSTTMVPVSAKTGEGIDELLEMVLLTADLLELKANPNRQAKGIVIEAKLDKQRGPVATLLVNRGTLHVGDTVVMGEIVGRVRAMTDAKGQQRKEAGPSVPVEIIGIPDVPSAGETFYQVENEKVARQLAEKRRVQNREKSILGSSRMSLDNLFDQMAAGEVKDLNLIVKADVQGSVEAVNQAMLKLSNDEVKIKIVHSAVGAITESDLNLAEVANAIVIGFNVRPAANVADQAKQAGIDLRLYRVIYHAIEEIEAAMKGLLAPKMEEVDLGRVEIRQVFKASNIGTIGGGYVTQGKITRNSRVRLVRDGVQVWDGKLASLKRFKDDVREVASGYECGISLENFNDIKEGDVIEAYEIQEVERA